MKLHLIDWLINGQRSIDWLIEWIIVYWQLRLHSVFEYFSVIFSWFWRALVDRNVQKRSMDGWNCCEWSRFGLSPLCRFGGHRKCITEWQSRSARGPQRPEMGWAGICWQNYRGKNHFIFPFRVQHFCPGGGGEGPVKVRVETLFSSLLFRPRIFPSWTGWRRRMKLTPYSISVFYSTTIPCGEWRNFILQMRGIFRARCLFFSWSSQSCNDNWRAKKNARELHLRIKNECRAQCGEKK